MKTGKVIIVIVLLVCFLHCSTSSTRNKCNKGWFGQRCQYKCRCSDNRCDVNGSCQIGSPCQTGWFGPECQYSNIILSGTVYPPFVSRITDNDESTCNDKEYIQNFVVSWPQAIPFSWLRLGVNTSDLLESVSLHLLDRYGATLTCRDMTRSVLDDRTLDIHCSNNVLVHTVSVSGDGVKRMCYIYISGGRNVAIKQRSSQSSTYSYNSPLNQSTSDNAIDGTTSSDFDEFSCAHTTHEIKPFWLVNFTSPRLVNRYVLYNRDIIKDRLQGFFLEIFDDNKKLVFNYSDTTEKPQDTYEIIETDINRQVEAIKISLVKNTSAYLTLCEVEAYGDSLCSRGRYGRDCENLCNCEVKSETCFVSTGACPSGCVAGFYGKGCRKDCENGKYGQDCKYNCSQFCVVDLIKQPSVCHRESGTCHLGCINEYEGLQCLKLKTEDSDSSLNSGTVAGTIIAALLVVNSLVVKHLVQIQYQPRRWKQSKRRNNLDNVSQGYLTVCDDSHIQPVRAGADGSATQVDKPPFFTKNCDITPVDRNNVVTYFNTIPEPYNNAIAVDDLNKFMMSHTKEYFVEQFKKIPLSSNSSMSAGLSARNKHKNCYKNICPYDHSRVQLTTDVGEGYGDYINASYVQGYNNKVKFIASQGPSKVILEDFVRMLWEQETDVVVMLANLVEEGKQKCEKYWPEDKELVLGEIKISLIDSHVFSDCIIRKMLFSKANQATHILTQFHYIAWPDNGVPTNPWRLVDFEHRVASYPTIRPIVVHCSAGVGQTGTFITLHNVIRQAENTGFMDFCCTLSKLRQDRANMIQTADQYIFLHKAAQVAMVCLGRTVTSRDIIHRIEALEEIHASGQTRMEKEFKAVCNICTNGSDEEDSGGSSSAYKNSHTLDNKLKNRFNNVLPKEKYRPHLFCETKDLGEYINAVLLPSQTSQNIQLLTQLPLPTTIIDFWRMVTQYKLSLIVAFEVDPDDPTIGAYLPSESNKVMHCGHFEIETQSKNSEVLWEKKVLSIMAQKGRKRSLASASEQQAERCQVTHLKCTKCDYDPEELLAVVRQVRSYSPRDNSKVLYMCRNGADFSGLLCVLSLLLDMMDDDRQLVVPLVVGTIKNVRPQVIPTLDQYRTLYQALKLYSETLNTYEECDDCIPEMVTDTGVANCVFDKNKNDDENAYENIAIRRHYT